MSSDKVAHLDSASFEAALKDSATTPLVVDFWAPWCGPCKSIAPVLDEIANELGDTIRIAKINIDDHSDVATVHSIRSIPTLLFFKNGECVQRRVGLQTKKEILGIIHSL